MSDTFVGDRPTYRAELVDDTGGPQDVSTATVKEIRVRKPGGTLVTLTASFVTDGVDGAIEAAAELTTQDQEGVYAMQGYVEIAGKPYHSAVGKFIVGPPIPVEA